MINCANFLNTNRDFFSYDNNDTIVAWRDLFAGIPATSITTETGLNRKVYDAVTIVDVPSARTANGQNELRTMKIRTLKSSRPLGEDLHSLKSAIAGTSLETSTDIGEDVRALNLIVAKAASNVQAGQFQTFQIGSNKVFLCSRWQSLPKDDNMAVLRTHTGFFWTIKPGMGEMLLNVNLATSAFYAPILVSDYLDRIDSHSCNWGVRSTRYRGLKGVRVFIEYKRGDAPENGTRNDLAMNKYDRRVRTITGLGEALDVQRFELDEEGVISTPKVQEYLETSERFFRFLCTRSSFD